MSTRLNAKNFRAGRKYARGMTMLDIVLAIVIFVIGMLALASLQGNLTRSSADGNARTMATNIAEELIERFRTFEQLPTEAGKVAYQDIVDDPDLTFVRGGITFTVEVSVDDYFYLPDNTVTKELDEVIPEDRDTSISDFKYVELDVSWESPEFVVNEGTESTDRFGSGSLTVSGIIPATPSLGSAKIAAEDDGKPGTPPIDYTPGARPNIIAISVNDSKFKESTTPRPDVIRQNELTETWFDVITYNTSGEDSYYLRREEFVVLTCECELNEDPDDEDGTGFLPTVWNGFEYTEGEWVSKPYGTSANNQQSQYCDTCCRDHHDSASHTAQHEVYDPSRQASPAVPVWSEAGGLDGDHKHFERGGGGMSEVGDGGDYVEACRMVRKDGFLRVAQDFRQEGFIAFPEGYLDTAAGVDEYSDYVTEALDDFYAAANQPDALAAPSALGYNFPADRVALDGSDDLTDVTTLPLLTAESQQLRSRGIYVDYRSPELLQLLTDLAACGYDPDNGGVCAATNITDPLQALPFYEIQTTWLSTWESDPIGTPVSVTSEDVADDNAHSRGLAVLENDAAQAQTIEVSTEMHRGNIGLTVTDEITPSDLSADALDDSQVYIAINGGSDGPPPPSGYVVSGTFTSNVNKVESLDTTITPTVGTNTFCQHSLNGLQCSTPFNESGGITITGYTKKQGQTWLNLWICVANFPAAVVTNSPAGLNNSATISWGPSGSNIENVEFTIEESACSP